MTQPHVAAPRPRPTWPRFVLGYLLGVALFGLLWLARGQLPDPCRGQTAVLLVAPLLLGPGGLGLAALTWNRPRWGLLGLGLVAASLFPAMFMTATALGQLRASGCAGAYVVFGQPGGGKQGELDLKSGSSAVVTVRIGGVRPEEAGAWSLSAQGHDEGGRPVALTATLGSARLEAGQTARIELRAQPGLPIGQYSLDLHAQRPDGRAADGGLTVNVTR